LKENERPITVGPVQIEIKRIAAREPNAMM
jgi:hypothetical protein